MRTLDQFFLNSNKPGAVGSYYKTGQGFPIVLLHGFAETFEIWNNLIPTLSEKYQLIIPHIPGCATADNFEEPFTMERIAQFVFDILEEEKIEKTILFGHSMGGYASMAFAEKYPNKLMGLSLVHSSAADDRPEKKNIRQTAVDHIRKNGSIGFFRTLIPKLYGSSSNFTPEKIKHLDMANQYTAEQIVACYTAMKNRVDRKFVLTSLDCPIQLIGGREDLSVNYQDIVTQAQICKKPSLHIFDRIAHTSMNENPKILLAAIIGFTDDILQTNES